MRKTLFLGLLILLCLVSVTLLWATNSTITTADYTTSKGFHDIRVQTLSSITVTTTGADTSASFDVDPYTIFAIATKTSMSGDTARVSWYPIISVDGSNWFVADSLVRAVNDTTYKITKFSNWSGVPALYGKLISQGRAGNDVTTVTARIIMQK